MRCIPVAGINDLDIKSFVLSSVNEVFDTMLSMKVEPSEKAPVADFSSGAVVGSVSFAGSLMGNVSLRLSNDFARVLTAAMLEMEYDEIEGEEQINDVIAEMSNMIGGGLKSRLCDSGFTCEISIPSITDGRDFKIESMNWARSERLSFLQNQHSLILEVYIKLSDNLLIEKARKGTMAEINSLDLKSFVSNALSEMFEKMLSMKVMVADAKPQTTVKGNKIVGSVSFAGELLGSICIYVPHGFAVFITAAMLGMEAGEIESEEEIHDVIGEVSNIVGGSLKSRFCDSGLPCELSIPSITSGSDFHIESMNWARCERYVFGNKEHAGIVEVFIKKAVNT